MKMMIYTQRAVKQPVAANGCLGLRKVRTVIVSHCVPVSFGTNTARVWYCCVDSAGHMTVFCEPYSRLLFFTITATAWMYVCVLA